jgi:hypothetical protein
MTKFTFLFSKEGTLIYAIIYFFAGVMFTFSNPWWCGACAGVFSVLTTQLIFDKLGLIK